MNELKIMTAAGEVNVRIHWELKPSRAKPSYVLIKQAGEVLMYEQFAPPNDGSTKRMRARVKKKDYRLKRTPTKP